MSSVIQDRLLVERGWPAGIIRDTARNSIPDGGVYDAVDFLFDRPGVIYKRGGSAFAHSAPAAQTLMVGVAAPEFPGSPRVIAIASDGASTRTLYDVTTGTPATGVSLSTTQPYENLKMFVDKLIITDGLGVAVVKKASLSAGTVAVGSLGGSPPVAKLSCVHLGYLVLANGSVSSTSYPNRVWFSPTPNIEAAWDTSNAYLDVPTEITGIESIQGVLIIFCRGQSWRVLGSVPPGSTGANMSLQPLGAVGCIDARSIVKMNGQVYFADESGVYSTNGGAPVSITQRDDGTGIGNLWAEAVDGYSPVLGSVVCAGVWLNRHLFITVRHAASDPQSGARYQFLYYEPTGAWTRLSDGVTADMYATANAPEMELYAACGDTSDAVRLLKLSGLFVPVSGNKADANGGAIEPTLTFKTWQPAPGLSAWGFGHLTFDMRDASSDNPTLAVAVANGVNATSFTTVRTLTETTDADRQRFLFNRDAQATTVRLTQANNSSKTEIYGIEADVRPYDQDAEGE